MLTVWEFPKSPRVGPFAKPCLSPSGGVGNWHFAILPGAEGYTCGFERLFPMLI